MCARRCGLRAGRIAGERRAEGAGRRRGGSRGARTVFCGDRIMLILAGVGTGRYRIREDHIVASAHESDRRMALTAGISRLTDEVAAEQLLEDNTESRASITAHGAFFTAAHAVVWVKGADTLHSSQPAQSSVLSALDKTIASDTDRQAHRQGRAFPSIIWDWLLLDIYNMFRIDAGLAVALRY